MHNIRRKATGIFIASIALFAMSSGGHGMQIEAVDFVDHHAQDHEHGFTQDSLADNHSEDKQCHPADVQVLAALTSTTVSVFMNESLRVFLIQQDDDLVSKHTALSPREKVPLFELATLHTTTLALRV